MIALLVALSVLLGCDALRLENGAYEGLVLQIEDDVPFEKCREVLANLEVSSSVSMFITLNILHIFVDMNKLEICYSAYRVLNRPGYVMRFPAS